MIVDDLFESPQTCPECGGPAFSNLLLAEKKDACYSKVRSRYKVWPSAYASGALVQCRKKGAANWGNKSKNESVVEDDAGDVEQRMLAKIKKEKQRLAQLKKTDPEAYKREMAKRKTSSRIPPVSTFEQQGVAEGKEDLASLRAKAKEISDKIDAIVKDGGRVGLDDPLSRRLKAIRAKIQQAKKQGVAEEQLDEKCWDTHKQVGMKNKGGRMVPNCVPKESVEQGVAEGTGNIGASIKALYQKIYRAGDDEIEYFYNDSPIFAQYWDEYEGDLDSIIAEVDPAELQVMHDELASYVQNANLAEGEPAKQERPEADYGDDYQAMVGRVKKLAGLGPLKTVWDPQKRVYKNVPVAQQPKK